MLAKRLRPSEGTGTLAGLGFGNFSMMDELDRQIALSRTRDALIANGWTDASAEHILATLEAAGIALSDTRRDQFPVRWVPVEERGVPPTADTLIRTLTRTQGSQVDERTFWLDGLRAPRF